MLLHVVGFLFCFSFIEGSKHVRRARIPSDERLYFMLSNSLQMFCNLHAGRPCFTCEFSEI